MGFPLRFVFCVMALHTGINVYILGDIQSQSGSGSVAITEVRQKVLNRLLCNLYVCMY